MTTVINNPGNGENTDGGMGLILGVFILLIVAALFFVYGLPAIRGNSATPPADNIDINVKLPATTPTP